MYKNLKAEMIKQNVSNKEIALLLGIKVETVRLKINQKIPINIEDCRKIARLFKDSSVEYLFATE